MALVCTAGPFGLLAAEDSSLQQPFGVTNDKGFVCSMRAVILVTILPLFVQTLSVFEAFPVVEGM